MKSYPWCTRTCRSSTKASATSLPLTPTPSAWRTSLEIWPTSAHCSWWVHGGRTRKRLVYTSSHAQAAAATHTYIILHVHSFASTHLVSSSSRCVLAREAEGPVRVWGARVKTCLRFTVLQSQPSLTPARLARGDLPAFLSNFCPFFRSEHSEPVSSWQKVLLLLEFTASPHQFAQHWHAWTAHLLCEFLHMSS